MRTELLDNHRWISAKFCSLVRAVAPDSPVFLHVWHGVLGMFCFLEDSEEVEWERSRSAGVSAVLHCVPQNRSLPLAMRVFPKGSEQQVFRQKVILLSAPNAVLLHGVFEAAELYVT